ncbi:MAG: hypothetical protein JNL67_17350 [Planctomycetaceae bacterium]|nr:hypothetical protein [Planctomycetaceae bacterium]
MESVTKTNIFGRLSGNRSQFLVYEMQFKSREPNAMILPIPTAMNPNEESVRFFNLEDYPAFFADIARGFPSLVPPPIMSRGLANSAGRQLQVQKVGAFVASVVPTVEDFNRLDPQFSIAPKTWAKLPNYNDYSFVVFQLDELEGRPHPMAFEFQTRHTEEIFFPTVHIHDGEVHDEEDFDHQLYLQFPSWDEVVGQYTNMADEATQWVRSQDVAQKTVKIEKAQGIVAANQLLHRRTIVGQQRNEDTLAAVHKKTSNRPLSGRMLGQPASWLGALMGVGAMAWLLNRRTQLQNKSVSGRD